MEFVEQPFPAGDVDSFTALRELSPRLPVIIDEGCQRPRRDVAAVAAYADGINIKLAKCGGIREALRMIHAARALGLQVMLGCMIESELGIAQAAQLASLADHVDLDGHLLISSRPFAGLGFRDGGVVPRAEPGPGGERAMSDARLAIFTEGLFDDHHAKTAHGVIRYGTREVVAVVDSTQAGRTASEVMPFCQRPVPIVATLAEAAERGADTMLIGIAPTGGKLDSAWRALVLEAIELGLNVEAGLHTILSEDPELAPRQSAAA